MCDGEKVADSSKYYQSDTKLRRRLSHLKNAEIDLWRETIIMDTYARHLHAIALAEQRNYLGTAEKTFKQTFLDYGLPVMR